MKHRDLLAHRRQYRHRLRVPRRWCSTSSRSSREHGSVQRGWLGVSLQPMDQELAQGAARRRMPRARWSPRWSRTARPRRGGIRAGRRDHRHRRRRIETPRDLAAAVADVAPGRSATLAVLRDGSTAERRIEVGTNPANRNAGKPAPTAQHSLGIGLAPRPEGRGADHPHRAGSLAEERGLRPGDVVVRAGEREAAQPQDVVAAVAGGAPGRAAFHRAADRARRRAAVRRGAPAAAG